MENFYETLGVREDADQDQIKKAFRTLAKMYHPDMGEGDDEKFRAINKAYGAISNADSRRDYDRTLFNFRNKSGNFDSYTASEVYEIQGKHLKRMVSELMRQTEMTRVKIKYEGRVLFDMPLTTAMGITMLGFLLAPVAALLINIGLDRYLQVEVTNAVVEKYEKAAAAHEVGNVADAEKFYKEAIALSEYFLPAHLNLGMLYRQRGENKLAIECFKKVLEVAPFGELGQIAKSNLEALRGF